MRSAAAALLLIAVLVPTNRPLSVLEDGDWIAAEVLSRPGCGMVSETLTAHGPQQAWECAPE